MPDPAVVEAILDRADPDFAAAVTGAEPTEIRELLYEILTGIRAPYEATCPACAGEILIGERCGFDTRRPRTRTVCAACAASIERTGLDLGEVGRSGLPTVEFTGTAERGARAAHELQGT